jgi:putative colanic acid biosynthesis glycosyltransferase
LTSPSLTIITVVLDDAEALARSRNSLTIQIDQEFQWVVKDGGSRDDIMNVVNQHRKPDVYRSSDDEGIYDAMNSGLELAKGSYVLFLNAGDELAGPEVVGRLKLEMGRHSNVDVLYGDYVLAFENGRTLVRRARAPQAIWHSLPTSHQAMLFRRTALPPDGFDLRYRICGDYWLAAELWSNGYRFARIDMTIARFAHGGVSSQNARSLILDAWRVQESTLGLRPAVRVVSVIRRWTSIRVRAMLGRLWTI